MFHVHGTAVTRPGVSTVIMAGGGGADGVTEGHITRPHGGHIIPPTCCRFPSTTLDSLLAGTDGARLLVKLDVEGHELGGVLEGASALLERTEVVVAEFAMFRLFDQPMTIPA